MKTTIFLFLTFTVFAVLNYAIFEKEQIRNNGETVYLQLAPVDPRSLMQGDYMRLRYAIEREVKPAAASQQPKRGHLVVALDENSVARFVRFHEGEELQKGEKLLRYHRQASRIRIVPDSFFFQEGHAKYYRDARFGQFKLSNNGGHLLVGLASEELRPIEPKEESN